MGETEYRMIITGCILMGYCNVIAALLIARRLLRKDT